MNLKDPEKFNYAEKLYIGGTSLKEIGVRLSISPNTLTKWKQTGSWDEKKQASTISTDSLILKAKQKTAAALDDEDFNADALSKTAAVLARLQKRITADDKITVLMDCGDFCMSMVGVVPGLTGEAAKLFTTIQDLYITQKIRTNG